MADERNRWLDRAAAERLLRGEPPVGPDADEQARADAARLRAALAALAPAPAGRELPGEAAALAAFRTFHAAPARLTDVDPHAAADAREPLIDLSPAPLVRTPAQRRRSAPLRFGLAAALASVAVGGLAAAASGLLDGSTHDSAAPGPAVSVSADADPTPSGDVTAPTPGPQPTPLRDREGAAPSPGASRLPGTEGRKDPGVPGSTPGPAGTGTAGDGHGRLRRPQRLHRRHVRRHRRQLHRRWRQGQGQEGRGAAAPGEGPVRRLPRGASSPATGGRS